MNASEQVLNTLEELSKIKHSLNQKILQEITKSAANTTDPNIKSLVKTGVDIVSGLMDGGRKIEETILTNLRTSVGNQTQGTAETPAEAQAEQAAEPAPVKSDGKVGTILIKASNTSKTIEVPINISNNGDEDQEVNVSSSYFKNMETGKQAISKINIAQPKINLKAKSAEKVLVTFDMSRNLKPDQKYFTSIVLNGRENRTIEIILEVTADTGTAPEIKFNPIA